MTRRSGTSGFTLTELAVTMVVLLVVGGIITQTALSATRSYGTQQHYLDARKNVGASLDMLVRLARMATTINPDPDGNGLMDSIRLRSDWNPRNGAFTDPYEDITFTVVGEQLMKQEPTDASPVPFADRVASITFTYFDTNNNALANPVASAAKIAYINIAITTTPPKPGMSPLVISSAAAVRGTE